MSFLAEIIFEEELKQIQKELEVIEQDLETLKPALNEGVLDLPSDNVGQLFYEAIRRLEVAKNAFGITNKLRDPEQRKQHRTKILGYMNKLRAMINRLVNMIAKGEATGKSDYSDVIDRYRS